MTFVVYARDGDISQLNQRILYTLLISHFYTVTVPCNFSTTMRYCYSAIADYVIYVLEHTRRA